jgi:hypothetical protein
MSFAGPPPAAMAAFGPVNPVEALINSLNTNPYLIGMSMILLNLGGRHLSMGLTQQQDKFFQNIWMRRAMLFVVIFVATRNVFTALWLSIALILIIGYLFNEHSNLYLFGPPLPLPAAPGQIASAPATVEGLTNEEQEIYKRLHDKAEKTKAAQSIGLTASKKGTQSPPLVNWYKKNMAALRRFVA